MITFYTYLWLRENGTPYYAGKGHGTRAFRKGCPPRERIIIQEWTSEGEAFEAERLLIACYGRKDNGTGILRNYTDGGEGPANPAEHILKAHSVVGRKNVETGHLKSISVKGGLAAVKSGQIFKIATREARSKGGQRSGQQHIDSGHIQALGRKYGGKFLTREVCSKAGRIGGKTNARTGHMQRMQRISNHVRWHVRRGIVRPACALCVTNIVAEAR